MTALLDSLRLGAQCRVDEIDMRVAAKISCRSSDRGFWNEWLLVVATETVQDSLDTGRARWLVVDGDQDPTWWRQIDAPEGSTGGQWHQLASVNHQYRNFRMVARDSFVVIAVRGDAGDRRRKQVQIDYSIFTSGSDRLCLEADSLGVLAYSGQTMANAKVEQWFRDGRKLSLHSPATLQASDRRNMLDPSWRYRAGASGLSEVRLILVVAAAILFILLESCGSDCTPRYNESLGKTQYVCTDGSIRSSRGWFGK